MGKMCDCVRLRGNADGHDSVLPSPQPFHGGVIQCMHAAGLWSSYSQCGLEGSQSSTPSNAAYRAVDHRLHHFTDQPSKNGTTNCTRAGKEGIAGVAAALWGNKSLKELDIRGNPVGAAEAEACARSLADALQGNTTLCKL